jgi:uncharacterized protein
MTLRRNVAFARHDREILRGMSQENVEFARRLYDAWNRHDLAASMEILAPEIVIDRSESLADARIYRGRAEAEQFWNQWIETWERFRWEIEEYLDAGESVVVVGRFHGRGTASGADVQANVTQVLTFRDRLLVRAKLFQSRSDALEAAGLSE